MAVRNNFSPNTFTRPTNVVLNEILELHKGLADCYTTINVLFARMESAVRNVSEIERKCERQFFHEFSSRGLLPGNFVRFIDAADVDKVYFCTGIDGEGFWLREFPFGKEYKLKVRESIDRARAVRRVMRKSQRMKNLLADNNIQEDNLNDLMPSIPEEQEDEFEPIMAESDDPTVEQVLSQNDLKRKARRSRDFDILTDSEYGETESENKD